MLQHLIIILDDTSVSYCHYNVSKRDRRLIDIDVLKSAILFAMKENLLIQFVFPDYELPIEYMDVIDSVFHSKIVPSSTLNVQDSQTVVFTNWDDLFAAQLKSDIAYVVRTSKDQLFEIEQSLFSVLCDTIRLNVVLTDIDSFNEDDFDKYKDFLHRLVQHLAEQYVSGRIPQINMITDRVLLTKMNNCEAGVSSVAVAPDGYFYLCPAFYYEAKVRSSMALGGPEDAPYSIGHVDTGLNIKNSQLYKLDHAPLCRICDAFQCRRCIWLNRKMTLEVNTPSHEQCVLSHLERNASRDLLYRIKDKVRFLPDGVEIPEIAYLDPFDIRKHW